MTKNDNPVERDAVVAASTLEILPDKAMKAYEAWPFYIVCDVSQSMWSEDFRESWGAAGSPHAIMSESLVLLLDELYDDDEARACSHIGVVTFGDEARSHLPLSPIRDNPVIAALPKGTWTNYVGVWELLAEILPRDLEGLNKSDFHVRRPTIFFLSDGRPGSQSREQSVADWSLHYDKLYQARPDWAPRVVSIGLGGAVPEIVYAVHSKDPHGLACISEPESFVSDLMRPVVEQVKQSMRNSSRRGKFVFTMPAGMVSLCDSCRG